LYKSRGNHPRTVFLALYRCIKTKKYATLVSQSAPIGASLLVDKAVSVNEHPSFIGSHMTNQIKEISGSYPKLGVSHFVLP